MTNLDLTLLHNIANHGRGSEMTAALHLTIDEIKMLDELNQELISALESALKNVEFERQAYRPWHDKAKNVLAKTKGGL